MFPPAADSESEPDGTPHAAQGGELPRLHDLPRLAARFKACPEDFEVEEIPAYAPSGVGEHLFLWIEKRGISAEQLLAHLSRTLHVRRGDIGMAGLKDRQAVTRQYVSVPAACEPSVPNVETDSIHVLAASRHRNKLKTGHLRGNRFRIVLRGELAGALDQALALTQALQRGGFPNYYGDQRFGIGGETAELGFALLSGRKTPADIPAARRKFLLRLALSAAQSDLFNTVLAERIRDGLMSVVLAGDVMQVVETGGCFVAEQVDVEQQRRDRGETAITGPMFGPSMKLAGGVPAAREQQTLTAHGLQAADFQRYPALTSGTRRPLVIMPGDLQVSQPPGSPALIWEFSLPRGVYATSLMREVLR